ncbi:RDD family protein [Hymenobacter sp. YC55]|uniref:RDD family protein n=1 Tax=Hymenobacter sp. YC55 TaxID=3034019 RepID=UPI0023F96EF1|nr:RDD family protein [Hymenobacter sp. YC55]MDF7813564.1 RDD family protein [Hymenobacter sp. YC55]
MQQDYLDQDYSDEPVEKHSVFAELLNSPLAMRSASTGQRFLNYIVDLITFYAIIFSLGIGLGMVVSITGDESLFGLLDSPLATLVYILIMLSYYFIMESMTGRTMGKIATRTRVVMEDGSKLTTTAAFQRTLSRIIPFEAFTFFGGGPGLHDRLAKTRVVKVD